MTRDRHSRASIEAAARAIAERRTGMPAYLVDDETWAAAMLEAEEAVAQAEPAPAPTALSEAIRKARGQYTGEEIVSMIEAFNRGRRG